MSQSFPSPRFLGNSILLLSAILLGITTVWLHQTRFTFGPNILPPLSTSTNDWEISHPDSTTLKTPASATLTAPKKGTARLRHLTKQHKDFRFVLAQARLKTTNATQGTADYMHPRIIVAGYTKDLKGHWKYPHTFLSKSGTTDWTTAEAVFEIFPDMVHLGYDIQHLSPTGSLTADSLSLRPAYEKPHYRLALYFSYALWLLLIALFTKSLFPQKKLPLLFLHTLILLTAFYLTVFPGANRIIHPLLPSGFVKTAPPLTPQIIPQVTPPEHQKSTPSRQKKEPKTAKAPSKKTSLPPTTQTPLAPETSTTSPISAPSTPPEKIVIPTKKSSLWQNFTPNKKTYHLLLFSLFTLTSLLFLNHWKTSLSIFLSIALLSEITQALQTQFPRLGDLTDLLLNLAGVLLGALLWHLLRKVLPQRTT